MAVNIGGANANGMRCEMLLQKPKVAQDVRVLDDGNIRELWRVYCGTDATGKAVRHYRATKAEAESLAREIGARVRRVGDAASILDAAQIYDASEAILTLAAAGAKITLTDCARQWVEKNGGTVLREGTSIRDCIDSYMKRFDGGKHASIVGRALLKLCQMTGGDRPMSDVTRREVEAYLAQFENNKTHNLNRGYVMAWLNWSRKNGMYSRNRYEDCLNIERRKEPYRRPAFFDAERVEKIMRWAEARPDFDRIVPKFAIGFFAGIRSEEVSRMDWTHIHFDDMTIRVEQPKGVEGTPPRVVTMSENLAAWLRPCAKPSGKVGYGHSWITECKKQLADETGIDFTSDDNRNVMRHTFATMHAAFHRNYELTASELGHGASSAMLMRHYKSVTSKADAEAFWSIFPACRMTDAVQVMA